MGWVYFLFFFCGIISLLHGESAFKLHPRISAKAAVLINADTGQVLFARNEDEPLYPASTTKILTALYALEKKGHAVDALVTASSDAIRVVPSKERRSPKHPSYRLEYGGTHIGLVKGETLPFSVLLHGLLLQSGNDAANVIAEFVSGNVEQFVKELNLFIQKKGCTRATLMNPHGLSDPNHKISARELALLTREAMQIPLFREVVRTVRSTRPKTDAHPEAYFMNSNALIKPNSNFYDPRVTGVKIGYTEAAGHAIVASAEAGDRRLIAVLFGVSSKETRYKEVTALFEAAFAEKKVERKLYSKEFDWFRTEVPGGNALLEAKLQRDLIISTYPSEEKELRLEVAWKISDLPISTGEKVGEVCIYDSDAQLVASAPLFADQKVDVVLSHRLWKALCALREGMQKQGLFLLGGVGFALLAFASQVRKKRKKLR